MTPYEQFIQERRAEVEAIGQDEKVQGQARDFMQAVNGLKYSYHFDWMGRPIIQYPQDIVAMQELIWEIQPDLIIEMGIAHGGSLIFSASMLALLDLTTAAENGNVVDPKQSHRHVLGVDIDIREHNRQAIEAHPMASRISMIQGSSISPDVIEQVRAFAKNYSRVLVCLDSNHTHDHVLAELEAYASLTSIGSYCVVFDTVVEDMPKSMFPDRPWGPGDNPKTAVHEFLKSILSSKSTRASSTSCCSLSHQMDICGVFDNKETGGRSVVVEGGESPSTLVSIGVPTYNRPDLLARTLQNLLQQTWQNIDIIISDNASTDPRVAEVVRSFEGADERVRAFLQPENIGPLNNFFFVLKQSRAPFFMWAADDDYIAPWFVERCIEIMLDQEAVTLCTAETQYISSEGAAMELVPQGAAFRKPTGFDRLGRMDHMIQNNFDNLIYGLFRRDALIQNNDVYWSKTTSISNNEIPALLTTAYHGEVIVLPDAGIFKTASQDTYAQAAWEENGGRLPSRSRMTGLRSMISTWRYHEAVIQAIELGLEQLDMPAGEKHHLIARSRSRIRRHFLWMLAQYKPRSAPACEIER